MVIGIIFISLLNLFSHQQIIYSKIYFIAILDFEYDENATKFRRDVCLKDQDGDVFFDKLNFKFLQMPLFKKQEDELIKTHRRIFSKKVPQDFYPNTKKLEFKR